jgi:flagellin
MVMPNTINTNGSAMLALQSFNRNNSDLAVTERRISTGKTVTSTKDNGAVWAVAQGQMGQAKALDVVTDSLNRVQSILDVTLNVSQQLSDDLIQMKSLAMGLWDRTIPNVERQAIVDQISIISGNWDKKVKSATFSGVNLLNSPTGSGTLSVPLDSDSSAKLTITKTNLTIGYWFNWVTPSISTTDTFIQIFINNLNSANQYVGAAIAQYSSKTREVAATLKATATRQDSLIGAVGNLVDADMGKESARLQSQLAKLQLGAHSLRVANGSTSILRSLFRPVTSLAAVA